MVGEVFSSVASSYDVMNDLMSGGIHRLWKDDLIRELQPTPRMHLLDVAGGTGDIAFRFLDKLQTQYSGSYLRGVDVSGGGGVTITDINKDMLDVGRERYLQRYPGAAAEGEGVSWAVADAMALPFEDNTFDAYTISFGLRNVTDMDQALREAHRVLKPGGRLLVMEFSHVNNPVLKMTYDQYSSVVIPQIGAVVAGDRESYQYLVESIRKMPTQMQLLGKVSAAGFSAASFRDLTFGVVAIHSGFKL